MIINCYILNIPWHRTPYLLVPKELNAKKSHRYIQTPISNGISPSNSFKTSTKYIEVNGNI